MRIFYVRCISFQFLSELCRGKATAAYTKPQQWKKEIERLRGEGGKIKFIDIRFDSIQDSPSVGADLQGALHLRNLITIDIKLTKL